MRTEPNNKIRPIQFRMIAPCGMNCALCSGHLRERKRCPGCSDSRDELKPPHCVTCSIKDCEVPGKVNKYCFRCSRFPCRRLRQLDKRYQTKYGMSMIENLEFIRDFGVRSFVAQEKVRWACPECGKTIGVHHDDCMHCGHPRNKASTASCYAVRNLPSEESKQTC